VSIFVDRSSKAAYVLAHRGRSLAEETDARALVPAAKAPSYVVEGKLVLEVIEWGPVEWSLL